MKKVFLLLALALLSISTASALEPIKVAIVNTGTAPVSVEIRLNNYTGGTATLLYTQPATNYTPNGSGIIIANISGAGWTAIASNTVTNYHILDVYVGASLVAQYRLDNLLLSQSQGGIFDIEGNLSPSESGAGSVGTDDNRWGELYVTGNTVHIGPTSGEAGNTELALSYNGGTAKMTVDNTDVLTATSSGVTIPGTLTATGVTTLGNLTGAGTRNIAVNASGEVVVAESAVNTDATINGNGTTGSPLSLADNAVATAKINDGAVTTTKINNDAVTTGKIATGAVTTDKIGSSAVTDVKIGSSAVTTDKINDGAVTEAKLADDAVATAKIEDKAVTAAKISPGATNGHVLTVSGTDAVWAAPAGGGGGSNTFFLEFTSFSNSSCCNDRSLNEADPYTAGAGISMNSTQPKPSYGQPFAVDLEVVSVSVYLNLTAKSLTAPVVFNVTPYIVNMTTGATDRALTSPIDLATLAEDQWHTISLSSSTPADNLVDASAGQYVMWELNSTHGGNWDDTEGVIMFRVEVKYP